MMRLMMSWLTYLKGLSIWVISLLSNTEFFDVTGHGRPFNFAIIFVNFLIARPMWFHDLRLALHLFLPLTLVGYVMVRSFKEAISTPVGSDLFLTSDEILTELQALARVEIGSVHFKGILHGWSAIELFCETTVWLSVIWFATSIYLICCRLAIPCSQEPT